MEKCVYRIPVKKESGGVSQAFNEAVARTMPGVAVAVAGELRQQFCNGFCQLLAANDMGPMECQQPNHSEKDCPDIASYRK